MPSMMKEIKSARRCIGQWVVCVDAYDSRPIPATDPSQAPGINPVETYLLTAPSCRSSHFFINKKPALEPQLSLHILELCSTALLSLCPFPLTSLTSKRDPWLRPHQQPKPLALPHSIAIIHPKPPTRSLRPPQLWIASRPQCLNRLKPPATT